MIDPEHARPGSFVPVLALDAALPLYSFLRIPPDDGSLRLHKFLKEAVEYAKFAKFPEDLWISVVEYGKATLIPEEQEEWLGWIFTAFTGSHPSNVDLSGWLIVFDHIRSPSGVWQDSIMDEEDRILTKDFVEHLMAARDEAAFLETIDDCRSRPLTDWDKYLHQVYGFVYFDRQGGKDPFLSFKFANQGEAFRRALKSYDFDAMPDFPHDKLHSVAQKIIGDLGVWMPEGKQLSPLLKVQ